MSVERKENRIVRKKLSDMPLGEFNLLLLLAVIAIENLLIFPIAVLFGGWDELAAPILIIVAGCGLLMLLDLWTEKYCLSAFLALLLINGVCVPMILRPGHVVYGVAIMWFASSMLIVYSVFSGLIFFGVLILFIFLYGGLYGRVFLPADGTLFNASEVFHFYDMAICFVGTAALLVLFLYIQEGFYQQQQNRILRSSSKIKRAGTAKRQFLANMSYEIRTPMNAIINLSEIMMKGDNSGETKSAVNTVRSAAYDLLSIIDDVLTYAKLDAGDTKLSEDTYSFESLYKEIVRSVSEEVRRKGLYLEVHIDGGMPRLLYGDRITIRQIFLYLLFVSLDFTSNGRIILTVSCEREAETGTAVLHCMVADTGKGLSQIDIQSLFGMYDIYDSRQSSNLKGVGLKFTICKELLAMMQGDIEVKSFEGIGLASLFTFRQRIVDDAPMVRLEDDRKPAVLIYADNDLDMTRWQDIMDVFDVRPQYVRSYYGFDHAVGDKQFDFIFVTDKVYESLSNLISLYECQDYTYVLSDFDGVYGDFGKCRPIHRPLSCIMISAVLNHRWDKDDYKKATVEETFTAKNARVLVVDDNVVNLKVADGIFQRYDIHIAVATSGAEAIRKTAEERYDIVLMDLVMPDMAGDEVLSRIRLREDSAYKDVPFVALTAQAGVNVREEMLGMGFQEYLAKPIKRRYLEKCLLEFLPEELIEHVIVKESGGAPDGKEQGGASEAAESGLNTDKGLLNIGFNREAYAAILNTYYTEGVKYLDLLPALLDEGNIQLFTTDVHGIKSSSASIGAMEVSALFKALEFDGKAGDVEAIRSKFDGSMQKFREILDEVKAYLVGEGRFSEAAQEDDLEGKEVEELTAETLAALKTELDKMNMKVTDVMIPELASKNFGREINAQIKKLRAAYDMFDFHQVKAIVNEMMEGSE